MAKPDLLIVKPGSQKQIYGKLSDFSLTAIEPPLWASLLAGYLRGLGYSVEVRDAEVEQWNHEETARQIKGINPLLAVISVSGTNPSASTMNMTGAGNVVRHLKQIAPGIRTLFHGLHPSALPERTLREEEADFVCQGEGFYTLPKLVEALKADASDLSIEGLWYQENGDVRSNPRPPAFKNLDELPPPAWDLLPMKEYRAHNWHCFDNIHVRRPYGALYTSLGCPYNCTFCCINAIFGKPGIRYRSPQNVVEDIDFLVRNYGIRNIKIMDEMFGLKEKRVVEICDLIVERGYDLNMWAYARVNTVTRLMLEKMKSAGIHWVAYGFESADKRVLDGVNKSYDLGIVENVVQMTRDAGLYIGANFIFGLPNDSLESMRDTLHMAQEINAEWGNFYTTMAYPGSKLHEEALEKEWKLPDTWQGYSQYGYETLPLPTEYLSGSEVLRFRDLAFIDYFSSARYQNMLFEKFGNDAVESVRRMLEHRLDRKYA